MWQSGDNSVMANDSGFFRSGTTPSTQDDRQQSRFRAQSLVSMTVGQVYKSMTKNDTLTLGDLEVSMISLVGLVLTVEQQTTHVLYEIDDMTGTVLKVQHWVDESDDENSFGGSKKPMVENTYVRVIGSMKKMRGEVNIIVFNIKPLTDINELTLHLLKVMHSKNVAETTLKQIQNKSDSGYGNEMPMDLDTSNAPAGLNSVQLSVYKTIQSCRDEAGCSVDMIMENVKSCTPVTIKQILTYLSDEGHIYSTIDDVHFKTTDGV